ncbi:MAG TPA: glyoxalase [Gammaproteobacteria bacterium]|nr:glyoxalase [Gammaproteobacteria bacterium]
MNECAYYKQFLEMATLGKVKSALLALIFMTALHGLDVNASSPIIESKFELFVSDVEISIAFYRALEFEIAYQKEYGYTTLRSGSTVIALSPISPWIPLRWFGFLRYPPIGTEIVLYTERLEELYSALETAGYDPGPIELQPWGDLDFRVTDYDGYYIRVSEGRAISKSD